MSNRHYANEPSPFACLEDAFAALSSEPRPLTFDGGRVAGLPDRPIPLAELRTILLRASTPYEIRDAVVAILLTDAQEEGGFATVGLAGMLLPGLRRAAYALVRSCPDRVADVEADMLAGLITALGKASPGRPRLAGWLVGHAFDAAKTHVRRELAERGRQLPKPSSSEPRPPYGHPDFVLAEAVVDGVINADDAELIGTTRLGGLTLKQAAYARGVSYTSIRIRRSRAERALVAYLRGESVPGRAASTRPKPSCPDTPSPVTDRHAPADSPAWKTCDQRTDETGRAALSVVPWGTLSPKDRLRFAFVTDEDEWPTAASAR